MQNYVQEAKESKEPGPVDQEGKDGGEKMEDDKEDDEVKMEAEDEDDDDDVDPLDAFMMGVHAEVKKIGSKDKKGPPAVEKAVKPTPGNGTGGEVRKHNIQKQPGTGLKKYISGSRLTKS